MPRLDERQHGKFRNLRRREADAKLAGASDSFFAPRISRPCTAPDPRAKAIHRNYASLDEQRQSQRQGYLTHRRRASCCRPKRETFPGPSANHTRRARIGCTEWPPRHSSPQFFNPKFAIRNPKSSCQAKRALQDHGPQIESTGVPLPAWAPCAVTSARDYGRFPPMPVRQTTEDSRGTRGPARPVPGLRGGV